jgi:SAM-dependent methyltransferase
MIRRLACVSVVTVLASALPMAGGQGGRLEPMPPIRPHLVYVPMDVAERMLELAGVAGDDVVYDLGCGDGRVAILAAKKYGARAVGVEVDPERIAEARANAEREGVTSLVRFIQESSVDLSEATVVTMSTPQSARWLSVNGLLDPTLTGQLKAGTRIVSNFVAGSMKNWQPERVDRFADAQGELRAFLYLWTKR